jgi:predicted nucleic acid-binding protein
VAYAIDTNVIIDVIAGSAEVAKQAAETLLRHGSRAGLVISPVVYCELFAHPDWGKAEIDQFLRSTAIAVDWQLSAEVWEIAGSAFSAYAARRNQQREGFPRRLLADFIVGAHALGAGSLITSDRQFYSTNFPRLPVVGLSGS